MPKVVEGKCRKGEVLITLTTKGNHIELLEKGKNSCDFGQVLFWLALWQLFANEKQA